MMTDGKVNVWAYAEACIKGFPMTTPQMVKEIKNIIKKDKVRKEDILTWFPDCIKQANSVISLMLIGGTLYLDGELYSLEKTNKYHNTITTVDGIKFRSKKESDRYQELILLEKAGEISDLKIQVPYVVADSVSWHGKTIKAIKYYADFEYTDRGIKVVEDTKGKLIALYVLKKSLFISRYPHIDFRES